MPPSGFGALWRKGLRLFACDDTHQHFGADTGKEVQRDGVFTNLADGAMRHQHFAARQLQTLLHGGIGDVLRTDRAKQFAFIARFGEDGQHLAGKGCGTTLGISQFFGLLTFQLGTTRFKAFNIGFGGFGCLALRLLFPTE